MALFACGCSQADEFEGDWTGFCEFDFDEVDVLLDIYDAKYGIVDGQVSFTWQYDEWVGEIDGTLSKDDVELSIDVQFEGDITWDGLFEGDIDDNEMHGTMWLEGGPFQLEGECYFED